MDNFDSVRNLLETVLAAQGVIESPFHYGWSAAGGTRNLGIADVCEEVWVPMYVCWAVNCSLHLKIMYS